MPDEDWNDLLNTDWTDLPDTRDRDDGLGWYYRDQPHGGFLVVAETEAYFHSEDTGEEVEVKLGIGVEFIDWGASVPDGSGYLANAQAAVHPDCLSESSKEDVSSTMGDPETLSYHDVAMYGYGVPIDEAHGEDWQEAYGDVKSSLALADIGVGFILDKPWNKIGTTGWDLLMDATEDVDAIDRALERARKRHEA